MLLWIEAEVILKLVMGAAPAQVFLREQLVAQEKYVITEYQVLM